MNCLIVESNKKKYSRLKKQVDDIALFKLVVECENIIQATSILEKMKVDLLLIDIEVSKLSTLDFLKNFADKTLVILIAANSNFAVEAFEHNVVDYMVQPVKDDRFIKSILRVKELYDTKNRTILARKEYFFFREKGVACKVKIDEILFVQAMGDYITIHTNEKKHTIHFTLNAMEKELPPDKFLRIHRSFIASLDKIETVEDGTAYFLKNNIPVGDKHRSSLMSRLNFL